MADVYKAIHPVKYFNDFISQSIRPDGRKFSELRDIKLSINCANTADASAVAKIGNTTVVCGIQLELAKPKAEEPEIGYVITNVEIPPLCSPKCRPGPPSDQAQVTNNIVSDMIINSKCIDLNDLCIVPDKLAWVLHCDLVCLDNDGSIIDACIIALLASLKSLSDSARVRVCGVPRSVSRAAAVKPRTSVPATRSGYPTVCTPRRHTVSAPRERSRSFHTPIPIAI
ncbi:Exosome complex component RRP43 [Eumeta japonica]|uniref:Ribosomal RNA-processing protein 43 n=1 Tax=Eumeta variegata TaxID=151549 RepID=A0A4C1V9I0_EUMVA|nr:Exosome complex component RRP43 [Eumeta japonica]